MVNEDAFNLIVENMQETPTNNKKVFARSVLHPDQLNEFDSLLIKLWNCADGENQRRLAIAFPQIAYCILEYTTLPEKKRIKYLKRLLNE